MIALAYVVASGAQTVPRAILHSGGEVSVELPASILTHKEAMKRIASGLTTAFALRANGTGPSDIHGATAIEIRYELWDETYLVTVHGPQPAQRPITLASREELIEWWSKTPHVLARVAERRRAPATLHVVVEMIPFSAREGEDARRWLATAAEGSGDHDGTPGGADGNSPGRLLDVIIATSVQRKPIHTWRWNVPVHRQRTQ